MNFFRFILYLYRTFRLGSERSRACLQQAAFWHDRANEAFADALLAHRSGNAEEFDRCKRRHDLCIRRFRQEIEPLMGKQP